MFYNSGAYRIAGTLGDASTLTKSKVKINKCIECGAGIRVTAGGVRKRCRPCADAVKVGYGYPPLPKKVIHNDNK